MGLFSLSRPIPTRTTMPTERACGRKRGQFSRLSELGNGRGTRKRFGERGRGRRKGHGRLTRFR